MSAHPTHQSDAQLATTGWRWVAAALALGAASVGCTFDDAVPPSVEYACSEDSQCPEGTACQLNSQRCVPSATLDLTPPEVVAASVKRRIRPGPGNPLSEPTALTFGSTIEVSFSVTERLSSITLGQFACSASCASPAEAGAGYVLVCSLEPGSTATDSRCEPRVDLVDLVGNRATSALAGFDLDVTAPPPPDTARPGRIVLTRAPWGLDGGAPTDWVRAEPGAIADGIEVLVRSNGVARAVVDVGDAGDFGPRALLAFDTADLQVAAVDEAGNTSAWARVLDGEWVATLGAKFVGDTVLNPHRLEGYSVASDAITRVDATEYGAADGLAGADGVGPRVMGGLRWEPGDFSAGLTSPGAKSVFDPARGRVVSFGGATYASIPLGGGLLSGDQNTYEWTGVTWRTIQTPLDVEGDGQPDSRLAHVMAYDPMGRRVLLHGGQLAFPSAGSPVSNETWAWNGQSWRRLADGPPLMEAAAFWSGRLSRLVVAGGRATPGGAVRSETWTFDGMRWETLDAGFPGSAGAVAVYAPSTGVAWAFLNQPSPGAPGELWRFEGQRWEWVDAGPGPTRGSTFIWNDERDTAWLMNGDGSQLWEWNGRAWARVTDAGPSGEAIAYDSRRGQLVVNNPGATPVATTLWTDAGVVRLSAGLINADAAPPVACSEPLGGCVRIFDGKVHELRPGGWFPRPFAALPIAPTALEWNPARGNALAVLTGGASSAYELRPDGGVTRVQDPPLATALGLTPWPGGVLLTDNSGANSLWNGSSWVAQPPIANPTDPLPLGFFSVGPLIDGGLCVSSSAFFGGSAATNYSSLGLDSGTPTSQLAAGLGAMMFDPLRELTFHFGGRDNFNPSSAFLYQSPLGQWRPVPLGLPDGIDLPAARWSGTLKYDPVHRRGVLSGGSPQKSDTWLLGASDERPGAVFRVARSALGVGDEARFTGVRVTAVAGGRSEFADGGLALGARGSLWADGRFKVGLAQNPTASELAPGAMTLEVTDPTQLETLLVGQPELLFGLTPLGTNGRGTAQLTVDYLELTVHYRLP